MRKLLQINIPKLYMLIVVLITIVILISYSSYAFFTVRKEKKQVISIKTGGLTYTLKNNQIEIGKGEVKIVTVELTSLNEIDSYYQLVYDGDDILICYIDQKDRSYGDIKSKKTKTIDLVIINNGSKKQNIDIEVLGGLIGRNLEIPKDKIPINEVYEKGEIQLAEYNYIGDVQEFVVPYRGIYKIELWGAQGGGNEEYAGGGGGYTSGEITLERNTTLYVYVGSTTNNYQGGYNGGGKGADTSLQTRFLYFGGGGSTDIRITSGVWNDFESLKSRIMVAAGGAGSGVYQDEITGGSAGGITGYSGMLSTYPGQDATAHTPATGGTNTTFGISNGSRDGSFGMSCDSSMDHGTGGGAGYYGGACGYDTYCNVDSGGGGSSFISGHDGCDAITKESIVNNIIHTGQSIHYSGYRFVNTIIIDGNGYYWTNKREGYQGMPTHDGVSNMTGNIGNGYAKITLLEVLST